GPEAFVSSADAGLVAVAQVRPDGRLREPKRLVALVADGDLVVAVLLPAGAVLVLGGGRRVPRVVALALAFPMTVAAACERHACKREGGDDQDGQCGQLAVERDPGHSSAPSRGRGEP